MAPPATRAALAALAVTAAAASTSRPNIVVILTDDQDVEMKSLDFMKKLRRHVGDKGVTFDHMYGAVPVCCPSRSVLLSGQYQHNNGVVGNFVDTNCSSPAWQQGPEKRSIATYLKDAGYVTSYAGKYLNYYGFPEAGGVEHIPPGWDNWQGLVGNSEYYDYALSNNGVEEKHGHDFAQDYLPSLILNRTLDFLDENVGKAPVFAFLSTPSCHDPTDAPPEYANLFPEARVPRTPAMGALVNHTHWIQQVQAVYGLDDNSRDYIDLKYRRRLQTLAYVDDMVEAVVKKMESLGQLDNTYFVFTSDNGYHLGHYGIVYDKRQPWRTDVHLPLLMSGPGITEGVRSDALVSMPDLSATILDMAGVPVPPHFDGTSMLRFVDPSRAAPSSRWLVLIEYHGEGNGGGPQEACPLTHGDPNMFCYEADSFERPPHWTGKPVCACQDSVNNTYNCLLARGEGEGSHFRYCEYADEPGTVEYFDFGTDPHELNNLGPSMDARFQAALRERLQQAVGCVGAEACEALLSAPLGEGMPGPSAARADGPQAAYV